MPLDAHDTSTGSPRQVISRGIVALHKKHVGRGPTHSRAYIERDLVTVLLHETLTPVERTLVDTGSRAIVEGLRHSYQEALCEEAKQLVEQTTGRRVITVVEGHAIDADYAVMCFPLQPEAQPPRQGRRGDE